MTTQTQGKRTRSVTLIQRVSLALIICGLLFNSSLTHATNGKSGNMSCAGKASLFSPLHQNPGITISHPAGGGDHDVIAQELRGLGILFDDPLVNTVVSEFNKHGILANQDSIFVNPRVAQMQMQTRLGYKFALENVPMVVSGEFTDLGQRFANSLSGLLQAAVADIYKGQDSLLLKDPLLRRVILTSPYFFRELMGKPEYTQDAGFVASADLVPVLGQDGHLYLSLQEINTQNPCSMWNSPTGNHVFLQSLKRVLDITLDDQIYEDGRGHIETYLAHMLTRNPDPKNKASVLYVDDDKVFLNQYAGTTDDVAATLAEFERGVITASPHRELIALFEKYNVKIVGPWNRQRLIYDNGKLFTVDEQGTRTEVGYIEYRGYPILADLSHPFIQTNFSEQAITDDMRRQASLHGRPGILNLLHNGQDGVRNVGGFIATAIGSDKALTHPDVLNKMAQLLGLEALPVSSPQVGRGRSIKISSHDLLFETDFTLDDLLSGRLSFLHDPTLTAQDAGFEIKLNQTLLDDVRKNPHQWVIKPRIGIGGGDGVTIGAWVSPDEWAATLERVIQNPTRYVVNRFDYSPIYNVGLNFDNPNRTIEYRFISLRAQDGMFYSPRTILTRSGGTRTLRNLHFGAGRFVAVFIRKSAHPSPHPAYAGPEAYWRQVTQTMDQVRATQ